MRRHQNPLFGRPLPQIAPETLLEAQRADHEEMEAFADSLRAILARAVDLPPETGSEEILALKEDLERHYEEACGLPGDHDAEKAAIIRLIETIMRVVRRHAGSDPLAVEELSQEEAARAIHFRLLGLPLIADLLHPDSPILPEELVAAVLTASESEVAALGDVFGPTEIALIADQAEARLAELAAEQIELAGPRARLETLRTAADQTGVSAHGL